MPPKAPSPRLTHFLCIPLVTAASKPQLQSALSAFTSKASSLNDPPARIPEKAIRPLGTLHLTLGVMSLLTPERIEAALTVLRTMNLQEILAATKSPDVRTRTGEAQQGVSEGAGALSGALSGEGVGILPESGSDMGEAKETLYVTLQGLHSMQDASRTSVLYAAPLDPERRLHRFCEALRVLFAGFLVREERRPLVLHATIVNTVYLPRNFSWVGAGREKRKGRRERYTLDARGLVREFEDCVWMKEVRLEKVAVCRMGAKMSECGKEEYEVEGEVEVPG
ncbi:hypothetical protein LZ554_000791 [Drepanopeziza brunnea f. sp. 'monogermtubi']|nr:hypothetical protein LZ554_000791 [Drepanopeziza brunnea f. sp. 'monogermtubi']